MDLLRIWSRFSREADIPPKVLERMQEEKTDWHLEEAEEGWILSELVLREQDLSYATGVIATEAGHVGEEGKIIGTWIRHTSTYVVDSAYPGFIQEPLHFRIRVGEPGHGLFRDPELYDTLRFSVTARGGDYLEYFGDTKLYHYDSNYHLLEVISGEGSPMSFLGRNGLGWGTIKYTTDEDTTARYILTEIRTRRRHIILPKKDLTSN